MKKKGKEEIKKIYTNYVYKSRSKIIIIIRVSANWTFYPGSGVIRISSKTEYTRCKFS